MWVIGTAGHVDHGKSTLVASLTGTHPDRLKEEQEREMTIELGFASLSLPGGEPVSIIDVPGHRDFIDNMLAGVGGIDAVLFVVAADEGIMPQTREHLAILDILQIPTGVIALTKIDLVNDRDWLDMVIADIREVTAGTVLADTEIIPVSARSGVGLSELMGAIQRCLVKQFPRPDLNRPRLPVDRVFVMPGFGTVVTGTLADGRITTGDEIVVLPSGISGRVRGLQTHGKKTEHAKPGSRVALNLAGIDSIQVKRGDVISRPGLYETSKLIDLHFRLIKDASTPLHHNAEVKFYLGATEEIGRVRLLGVDELQPGQDGWLQLELREPVVAARGDRYILRRPSPGETLGGGEVIEPHPRQRHKRFSDGVLERMVALEEGDPSDVIYQAILKLGYCKITEAASQAHINRESAEAVISELAATAKVINLEEDNAPDSYVVSALLWKTDSERALHQVQEYHLNYPLRRGIQREMLKSRMKLQPKIFQAAMRRWTDENLLVEKNAIVWLPSHTIRLDRKQQVRVDALLDRFSKSPYSPPTAKECVAEMGEELFSYLIDQSILISVSPEIVFKKDDYEFLVSSIKNHFLERDTLTVIEFRDQFNTSRKYALAFLEHLDAIGLTQRVGEARKLRNTDLNR